MKGREMFRRLLRLFCGKEEKKEGNVGRNVPVKALGYNSSIDLINLNPAKLFQHPA